MWVLGDVALGRLEDSWRMYERLAGRKRLLGGNTTAAGPGTDAEPKDKPNGISRQASKGSMNDGDHGAGCSTSASTPGTSVPSMPPRPWRRRGFVLAGRSPRSSRLRSGSCAGVGTGRSARWRWTSIGPRRRCGSGSSRLTSTTLLCSWAARAAGDPGRTPQTRPTPPPGRDKRPASHLQCGDAPPGASPKRVSADALGAQGPGRKMVSFPVVRSFPARSTMAEAAGRSTSTSSRWIATSAPR